MAFVEARLNVEPLEKQLRRLGRTTGRRNLARAMNAGLKGLEVEAKAEARKATTLKLSRINQAMRKQRARAGAAHVELGIRADPVPLIHFRARELKRGGVSFQVKKSGGRHVLKHAFIATMPSGHRGVFERDLKKVVPRKAPKYSGLRIRQNVSTGVAQHLNKPPIKRRIQREALKRFTKELDRQIKLSLAG